MNRFPTRMGRWLTAASACTLVGVCAPATAGASTSSAAPPIPPGYVTLIDDSNSISIMVPPTWTDIDTGTVDIDGAPAPGISASPNIQSFLDTFDTPGVRYVAFPYAPDPNTLIAQFGLQGGCASITTQPYDATGFVGVVQVGTSCGATGQATWNMVAASLPDHAFTAVVQIQTASPADQADFDAVLSTFGTASPTPTPPTVPDATVSPVPTAVPLPTVPTPTAVPLPTVPTPTAVPLPTVPTPTGAPVPTVPATVPIVPATAPVATLPVATTPTPTVAGATTLPTPGLTLTDDTGLLTVQVPTSWTYSETAPLASDQATIFATTDAAQAAQGTAPSLLYVGGPFVADPASVLGNLGNLAEGCTTNPVEPYDDNVFVGQLQTFTQCNGTGAMRIVIVANPPSQSTTVTLILTMPAFDEATVSLILQTFNVTR